MNWLVIEFIIEYKKYTHIVITTNSHTLATIGFLSSEWACGLNSFSFYFSINFSNTLFKDGKYYPIISMNYSKNLSDNMKMIINI